MRFKEDVSLDGVRLPVLRMLVTLEAVWLELHGHEPTVSDIIGGREGKVSLHPFGLAGDASDREASTAEHMSAKMVAITGARLQQRLEEEWGPGYQVIHHGPEPHFHVEFDPAQVLAARNQEYAKWNS